VFDLKYASSNLKKAAYLQGIRTGRNHAWYEPRPSGEEVYALVGDDLKQVKITVFDVEYAAQYTWEELYSPGS